MEFQVQAQLDMASNIRTQLLDLVELAIDYLQDYQASPEISVHQARVSFKRSRTLLRLVKEDIGKQAFAEFNGLLRDIGRSLSEQRDAHVICTKMKALLLQLELHGTTNNRICSDKISADDIETVNTALHQLSIFRAQILSLEFTQPGFSLVRQGSIDLFNREKRAFAVALKTGRDDDFHDWRKAAKHLYYWSCLLQPSWPGHLAGIERDLLELTRFLGRDHDYVLLKDPVILDLFELSDRDKSSVVDAIRLEQRLLRAEAEQLRGELELGQPENLVSQVEQHWNAFREGDGGKVRSLD